MEVITAPWGLRGFFSGQYYRPIDMAWRKINDDWRDFYPYVLPQAGAENDDEQPVAVELAVGDGNCAFKVIYPARMVFVPNNISQAGTTSNEAGIGNTDQEDSSRIREELNRNKIEHTVMSMTQHASRDVLPDCQNHTPFPGATSPFQPIEKLRPVPRTSLSGNVDKSKKFRLSTFHKKLGQDRFDQFCDQGQVELVQPQNQSSEVTPTSSAPTSVKAEVKEEDKEKFEEPPSPKWVEEKVEIWVGLKLPLDATGSTLKSDRCRPKLELDGLDPEVVYRKRHESRCSVDSLIFSEFKPRKRLKRGHISEEQEPLGIKRLAPESEPQPGELDQANFLSSDLSNGGKTEPKHEDFAFGNDDGPEQRITLKQEPQKRNESKYSYIDYGVLTPSPEQKPCGGLDDGVDYPGRLFRPIHEKHHHHHQLSRTKPTIDASVDSMASTLTPPTPKQDYEKTEKEKDVRLSRRKSTYELAEEKAQFGVYAPYRGELATPTEHQHQKLGAYQPSWAPGSNAHKVREARRAKQKMREQQKTMMSESEKTTQQPKMSQPLTPGSSSRNPRTPGMAPNTPGTAGQPPSTPGTYNPRTPGGPPSVGPVTPFGAPHTPGSISRNPHTPARSPGQAIAPSPASSRVDFSAPKTPRTPRTPGSVRTPGSKSTFGGRICGVSSLQEISALLLSLVLGDSVLDAHRDRNFIQAPLCVCRGDTVGIDGPLIGIREKDAKNGDDYDECTCGFSAISSRSSAVGRWGGILLEDEINLVGADIEADAFHIRARSFLDDCLRTTPEIKTKNGIAGIGQPNLQMAGQLLADLVGKFGSDGLIDADDYWNDEVYDLWNFALFHDAVSACSEALKTARCVMEPSNTILLPREVSENVITEFSLPQQSNSKSKTANHETIRLLR